MDPESGRLRGKFISDNVFNLSKKSFSEAEIKFLSRGLGFVPTPEKIDRWQVKKDLEKIYISNIKQISNLSKKYIRIVFFKELSISLSLLTKVRL